MREGNGREKVGEVSSSKRWMSQWGKVSPRERGRKGLGRNQQGKRESGKLAG
jgi:hypothetical protein